jgi:ribosomal protein S18 acetylase RimI-like enzyme
MTEGHQPVVEIRLAGGDDLPSVEPMWLALYEHQRANGMILELPPNAYGHWAASLRPLLGRFACLFLAESEANAVGFLAGRIRSLPQYFGGYPVGFISDVFVSETHRSLGIGGQMVSRAINWFEQSGIARVELQVITNNEGAQKLYRSMGWRDELVQMVWQKGGSD